MKEDYTNNFAKKLLVELIKMIAEGKTDEEIAMHCKKEIIDFSHIYAILEKL